MNEIKAKKKLVYQRPSLYSLDGNNASGLCKTGSAATGFVIPGISCDTGTDTNLHISAACISDGSAHDGFSTNFCNAGFAVTSNATSCDQGTGVL
jgi:uncharacterized protein CbrC (UPF0167 family)